MCKQILYNWCKSYQFIANCHTFKKFTDFKKFICNICRSFSHDGIERKRSSGKSGIQENLKTCIFTDVREAAYIHITVNSYFTNKEKNSDFSLQSRAEMNSLAVGHGRAGCGYTISVGKGVLQHRVCEDRISGHCAKRVSQTL